MNVMGCQEQSRLVIGATSRRILQLAIIVLVFVALFDPTDKILHIKVPIFIAVVFVWLYRRAIDGGTLTPGMWALIMTIAVVIPLFWTIFGIITQNAHNMDTQFSTLKSLLFLMIVPVLISEDIDLISLIIKMSSTVALVTIAMWAMYLYTPQLFLGVYVSTMNYGNAMIDPSRNLLGMSLGMFYYKTSCLMIFPLSYYCSRLLQCNTRWKLLLIISSLLGFALLISGTRANIMGMLFVVGALMLGKIKNTCGWVPFITAGMLLIVLIAVSVIPAFADTQEQGNGIKLGHLGPYEQEFATKPSVLLWGEGADSAFYSEGVQEWMTNTELTYMELIRVFGLPMTILFIAGILLICYKLFAGGALPVAIAYMAYLAILASNPLLISSTGLLVICAMLKQAVKPSKFNSMFNLPSIYGSVGCEHGQMIAWSRKYETAHI